MGEAEPFFVGLRNGSCPVIGMNKEFLDKSVERVFLNFQPDIRKKLLRLRALIFKTALETPDVGKLKETIKWGQPSYVTHDPKSGTTIRIGSEKNSAGDYGIYFHCQTTLISRFRRKYGDLFKYEKNRAILFNKEDKIPVEEISACIAMALTYHIHKTEK